MSPLAPPSAHSVHLSPSPSSRSIRDPSPVGTFPTFWTAARMSSEVTCYFFKSSGHLSPPRTFIHRPSPLHPGRPRSESPGSVTLFPTAWGGGPAGSPLLGGAVRGPGGQGSAGGGGGVDSLICTRAHARTHSLRRRPCSLLFINSQKA